MAVDPKQMTTSVEEAESMGAFKAAWRPTRTLPGPAYTDPERFERERERLFWSMWSCVGRVEQVLEADAYFTADVAGQSVILVRGRDDQIRGFYNSCAHRGTKLCDEGAGRAKSGVFVCPYHAWSYDTTGKLVGTPNVHTEEGFDRAEHPLFQVHVDTWNGFLFVNLSEGGPPMTLAEHVATDPTEPWDYERYQVGDLVIGATIEADVKANWKIVVDNYNECLHCPSVHPELVHIVPTYRKGQVTERPDWNGVTIAGTSFTATGTSSLPRLPGITEQDACAYYGAFLMPTLLLNWLSDCVFSMRLTPLAVDRTIVTTDFLFRPETVAAPGFDPSEIVDFVKLVGEQDWEVCERVQTGVGSRGFRSGGVYPFADRLISHFNSYYADLMGETVESI